MVERRQGLRSDDAKSSASQNYLSTFTAVIAAIGCRMCSNPIMSQRLAARTDFRYIADAAADASPGLMIRIDCLENGC